MEILPRLYLGGSADSEKLHDVALVVNCTKDLPFHARMARHIRIGVEDNGDPAEVRLLATNLCDLAVLREIDVTIKERGTVLVHCKMGQQRSAAVVAAYLMHTRQLNPQEAIAFVRSKKRDAFFFRANFEGALTSFHNQTMADWRTLA